MSTLWLTLLIMLVATCLIVILAGWRGGRYQAQQRDQLNTEFYQQRLNELDQDEAEGTVSVKQEMIVELQHNLLNDIPTVAKPITQHYSGRWVLIPAVLLLIIVSSAFYLKTGGMMQLFEWNQVKADYPQLRARLMDPQGGDLTLAELQRFSLGLQDSLLQQPDDLPSWAMLGRLELVLNNFQLSKQAFQRALALAPDNSDLKIDYAEILVRSPAVEDQRQAQLMLEDMLRKDQKNPRLLALLAADYSAQQKASQALPLWQQLLSLLPANSSQANAVAQRIEAARTEVGQQGRQLTLQIQLSPKAQTVLTPQGVLYISITDGLSPVPVAVKRLPLSRFPLTTSLDDSNAMLENRLLSAQHRLLVRVRISRDGVAKPQSGDWYGEGQVNDFSKNTKIKLTIDRQQSSS